jgi:hypothetical protein
MSILSRKSRTEPETAPEPRRRRVGHSFRVSAYGVVGLEYDAMKAAGEFFGPGVVLEITDDYVIDRSSGRYGHADIIVWAVRDDLPADTRKVDCPRCANIVEVQADGSRMPHQRRSADDSPAGWSRIRCDGSGPGAVAA